MANILRKGLQDWVGADGAKLLREAGLFDSNRFHFSKPITPTVSDLLVKLPTLKVLQFHDVMPDQKTMALLNEVVFKQRKDVTLRVIGYPNIWPDISFLEYLPEVERFDWDTNVFGSTKPLHKLKRLIHLGVGDSQPKPKISLDFVVDFSSTLESLSIAGDYKDTFSVIPQLRDLKSVWFVSTKIAGFEFLEGLDIDTFGNYGSRVANFEFLRNLNTLKRVWIKTNSTLKSIDFIVDLDNLERLQLFFISKLTRFPRCEHLNKLNLIFAYECNRLADITEIKKLQGVKISVSGKSLQGRNFSTPDFSMSEALEASGRYL